MEKLQQDNDTNFISHVILAEIVAFKSSKQK